MRNYSNAERLLAVTGFTPLLVNLESMIAKPSAGRGRINCVAWKVENAIYYFIHRDEILLQTEERAAAAGT